MVHYLELVVKPKGLDNSYTASNGQSSAAYLPPKVTLLALERGLGQHLSLIFHLRRLLEVRLSLLVLSGRKKWQKDFIARGIG